MRKLFASLIAVLLCLGVVQAGYYRQYDFRGRSFFDNFDFWTGDDPTHGFVNYVDRNTAYANGYVSAQYDDKPVYIGADKVNVAQGRGRDSVRLQSKATFNGGLFIIDLNHMPEGCGTWPAYWLCGPNWPNQGEIDVIEGVNTMTTAQVTLHTNDGCDMSSQPTDTFTGYWGARPDGRPSSNCWVNAPGQYANAGCGICKDGIYGSALNQMGGGVYAMEWTGDYIRTFFFPRNGIPDDIRNGQPNPNSWGKPFSYFQLGGNCPNNHFRDQSVIINLTFCGDWAGNTFGQQCPNRGNCNDYVKYNPTAFGNAYWIINYISVYQQG
jgi:hypothetical protein